MAMNIVLHGESTTDTNDNGTPTIERIKSTGGAGHVTTSLDGISHVRQEAALGATAVTMDFGTNGIKQLKLTFASEAAGTAELPAAVAVTLFNPPNDAVRDAWLTAGDSLTADSYMEVFFADKENETILFSSPVQYVGMKRLWGSQVLTAIGLGTEVTS